MAFFVDKQMPSPLGDQRSWCEMLYSVGAVDAEGRLKRFPQGLGVSVWDNFALGILNYEFSDVVWGSEFGGICCVFA